MDFDDILRDFESGSRGSVRNDEIERAEDVAKLTQAWIMERTIPELLPYEEELIDRLLGRIRKQIEFIELNSLELQKHEKQIKLLLVIVESELDRVQFLIRSYTRTRLLKIDKYAVHTRMNEIHKLSSNEITYMERHLQLLMELYNNQFLKNLPEALQAIDETAGGVSMIDQPDLNQPVFVKVLNDNSIEIDDEEVELTKDGIYVLRYKAVSDLIRIGDVIAL
ncbi:hypothetical protein CANARDRAFT_30273 [[Candida] arabinofermentans NRRL YB-2248]|uniref:DNA replication complex GINS protein SLD5 n=1 Tax=[Candida] arabinofermentans NRRL YB-2248 TaxID=983967 RepID=A0A1E4SUT3_9ASCO|nr:hypothetical protein CANARDRAFT_30273 [[Candida] arabinofermentans NRRL YB-2248]